VSGTAAHAKRSVSATISPIRSQRREVVYAHRNYHCCGVCSVGSVSWSCKAPCQFEHFVYDHSDRRVCCHLVCRGSGEHVDWCVASGVLVSRRAPDFPVDLLVAIRGSRFFKVEVPLSASTFCMGKNRLEAFSYGVIAIIITIMVLEMKVPHGEGIETLVPLIPVFLSYVLSFVYLGIYWNNHHHMLYACQQVTGPMLWANLHLLFWLSLIPFATGWMGENHFAAAPSALYGVVLLMAAVAYWILQQLIIASQGPDSILKKAIGGDWKGKLSLVLYAAAIPLAFWRQWISLGLYVFGALLWLIPDRRIENVLRNADHNHSLHSAR